MDRYCDTDDESGGYRPFDAADAFERVMWKVFWSEHDYGEEFDYEAFEDAVFYAVTDRVWDDAREQVREAQQDAKDACRDPYAYRGVRRSDFV